MEQQSGQGRAGEIHDPLVAATARIMGGHTGLGGVNDGWADENPSEVEQECPEQKTVTSPPGKVYLADAIQQDAWL